MNHDIPPAFLPSRRCGNCHHAARTGAFDGTIVTCLARLEYQCADHIADCSQYHPSADGNGPESAAA